MRTIAIFSLAMMSLLGCSSEVAGDADGADNQDSAQTKIRNQSQRDNVLAAQLAKFKIVIKDNGFDFDQAPPTEQTTKGKTLWRTDYYSLCDKDHRDWTYEQSDALYQFCRQISACRFETLTAPQPAGTTVSMDAGDKYRASGKATRSGESLAFPLLEVKTGADSGSALRCVEVLGPGDKKAKYAQPFDLEPPARP